MGLFGSDNSGNQGTNYTPHITISTLIGVAIMIFGIIRYYTHTTVNPTTGEKQHVSMSPEQEMALGLQSAPEMAGQMGGEVPANDPQARLVEQVGMNVMRHSKAADSPYVRNFRYHLLADDRTINAFALPGGQIFITRALLNRLTTEAQLAGVLGHETGHVIERHSAQQLEKGQLGQTLVTGLAVAGSDRRQGGGATMAAQVANQMLQLHYGRDDETQADTRGLQFMSEAGYDPRAMLQVMKILQEVTNQQGGRQPEMLQTHPYPEHRMQTIQQWIQQHYPNGVPSSLKEGGALRGAKQRDF